MSLSPQSTQSVPYEQNEKAELGPPSSQKLSLAKEHELSHTVVLPPPHTQHIAFEEKSTSS